MISRLFNFKTICISVECLLFVGRVREFSILVGLMIRSQFSRISLKHLVELENVQQIHLNN